MGADFGKGWVNGMTSSLLLRRPGISTVLLGVTALLAYRDPWLLAAALLAGLVLARRPRPLVASLPLLSAPVAPTSLRAAEPLLLELGSGLSVRLSHGWTAAVPELELKRRLALPLAKARQRLADELGLPFPEVRLTVVSELGDAWRVRLRGQQLAAGTGRADLSGLVEQLEGLARSQAERLLSVQEVCDRLEESRSRQPALVELAGVNPMELTLVLRRLVRERVSIRDLSGILEGLVQLKQSGGWPSDPVWQAEELRCLLAESIRRGLRGADGQIRVVELLDGQPLEAELVERLGRALAQFGGSVVLAPAALRPRLAELLGAPVVSAREVPEALVLTLGTLALFRGMALIVLGPRGVSDFPDWFTAFGFGHVPGTLIPWPFMVFLGLALVLGIVLHRTWIGRQVFAIGKNAETARFSGVRVTRLRVSLFVLSGVVASLAGVILTSRLSSARADAGSGMTLTVATVVLLGGVNIFGGSGTIPGVALAVLCVAVMQNALRLASVTVEVQSIALGLLLILSVVIPTFAHQARLALDRVRGGRPPPADSVPQGEAAQS